MLLNSRVFLREEEDCFIVYNGDNGKAVCLSSKDGKALRDADTQYFTDKDNEAFLYKLHDMGFIQIPDTLNKINVEEEVDGISDVNVLTLKSRRNPYKVLWGITPKCNLKCLYCWPDVASVVRQTSGLHLDELKKIANQLVSAQVCKVIISGGEALLCKDIWDIIKVLRDGGCTVLLISNGTTINKNVLDKIKANDVALGISIDASTDDVNAITRRRNIVQMVSNAIKDILKEGIPLGVLVTVTRHNFDYLEEHISYLDKLGVEVVILQDLRPFGSTEDYDNTRLTVEQEIELPKCLSRIEKNYKNIRFDTTELLAFSNKCLNKTTKNTIMQCDAGENSAYVDFHGNFFPCSFLETLKLGNLLDEAATLTDLWRNSENIIKLRKIKNMSIQSLKDCHGCSQIENCDGGCRGDALFITGDFYGQASRCPRRMGIIS
jgi:radical SAM protein with 4Fe4S-binding SPASM domain